ncbi:hypothetical protein BTA51_07900 [Hahella sp. CCB-MM4]|nr:hypothetical protein BTA51_07900 [Hahella sp. CCB-MM4]
MEEKARQLQAVFNELFAVSENTILVAGGGEPIYLPAGHPDCRTTMNEVYFAHGYANSALHEIAHWCQAGKERRKLVDYGYWYAPDGRTAEQQALFEKVEVKPQAIEWVLTEACDQKFNISFDNLNGAGGHNAEAFKKAVLEQTLTYLKGGLPPRAEQLMIRFRQQFKGGRPIELKRFCLEAL